MATIEAHKQQCLKKIVDKVGYNNLDKPIEDLQTVLQHPDQAGVHTQLKYLIKLYNKEKRSYSYYDNKKTITNQLLEDLDEDLMS